VEVFGHVTHCNIVISLNEETQLERLMKRNGYSKEEAENRIKSQMPTKEKIEKAEFVIENEKSLEELEKRTLEVLNKIKSGIYKE
jgi:dephospho-CoA kinase